MATSKPAAIASDLRGLDERWDPEAGAGLTASVAQDLWWDPRGAWQSSGGYGRIIRGPATIPPTVPPTYTNPFAASGAIESIHFFSQHTGARRWLIYINGSGALYMFNPATAARSGSPGDQARDRSGNTITRTVVSNPWIRSQSASWRDVFYMVNGIDVPLVFDGYAWDTAGWVGPAGAVTAVSMNDPLATDYGGATSVKIPNVGLGATSDTAGAAYDYKYAARYRVSYINERGAESPLSAPSELIYHINTGGTGSSDGAHFAKVDLPLGPPSCVARRLYRTQNVYDSSGTLVQGRDEQYFFHSDHPDNMETTFQDSLDDGYLGALVDELDFGPFPYGAKIISVFNDRLYASGFGTSEVYYSKKGNPEVFPVLNVLDVGDAHLGPITAMYATRNALVVAKASGIYLIKDDGVGEPSCQTLTRQSGWIAQNTIKEIPGLGIMGLSSDGITILKGTLQNEGVETQVFNAGVVFPETFKRLNFTAIANACAAVYHKDKEYWLCLPMLGSPNNTLTLVFHYEIREWTSRLFFPVASILETPDSVGSLLFASYAATSGTSPDGVAHLGIFVYSRGWADKDGTPITPVYQTNQISVAASFRTYKPLHILPRVAMHGQTKLRSALYANYSPTPMAPTQSVMSMYPQQKTPVYGAAGSPNTALFDVGNLWTKWFPGTVRFDLSGSDAQPVFTSSIRFEPEAGKRYMTLEAVSLEVQPADPTETKPLKPDGTN